MSRFEHGPPLGQRLGTTSRAVHRAFDDALGTVDGSMPMWLVLLALSHRPQASQRELSEIVGITEATLTHHLNAMERDGWLTRRRDDVNRRTHLVSLTPLGDAAFARMRSVATAFERRLLADLSTKDILTLEKLLDRLHDNIAPPAAP